MLVSQEQGGTAAPGKGTHISEPGLNCAELSCHPQQLLSLIPTLIYRSVLSPGTSPLPRKSRGSSDLNSPHLSPLPKQAVLELQHLQPALNHERQAGKSKAISAGKQEIRQPAPAGPGGCSRRPLQVGVKAFPGLTSGIHQRWQGPTWTGASHFLTGKTLCQAAAAKPPAGEFRAAQPLSE